MKLAIVGSRTLNKPEDFTIITNLIDDYREHTKVTEIISGGAIGVDTFAVRYAVKHTLPFKIISPDYKKYGKQAPLIRNKQIVDECDKLIAFWDGKSKGTKYTIDEATKQDKLYLTSVI